MVSANKQELAERSNRRIEAIEQGLEKIRVLKRSDPIRIRIEENILGGIGRLVSGEYGGRIAPLEVRRKGRSLFERYICSGGNTKTTLFRSIKAQLSEVDCYDSTSRRPSYGAEPEYTYRVLGLRMQRLGGSLAASLAQDPEDSGIEQTPSQDFSLKVLQFAVGEEE